MLTNILTVQSQLWQMPTFAFHFLEKDGIGGCLTIQETVSLAIIC